MMVNYADHDLLPADDITDRLQIAGARRAGLERDRVGIDLVERPEGRSVALDVAENALLRRVTPAGVAPHLGLATQPFDRVVEDLDEFGNFDAAERLAPRWHHVDLRLLHLDHRATGIGECIELSVDGFAECPD